MVYQPGYRSDLSERKVRTVQSNTPVNNRLQYVSGNISMAEETGPQKITTLLRQGFGGKW